MPFRNFFFATVLLCVLASGCGSGSLSGRPDGGRITVMAYNTQAFFDGIEDGTEFDEYRGAKSLWSAEKYVARLDRLRETILLCGADAGLAADRGPDIVVLEEIENERVLKDLCNRLPQRSKYGNAVFVPPEAGSAFASAVLSRYPVESVSVHSVAGTAAALRPLLEVRLKTGPSFLVVFAVHWKSKSGADTAPVRLRQEALLRDRIDLLEEVSPEIPYIACGDFNQQRGEFTLMDDIPNCWDKWLEQCASGAEERPPGSYLYQGNWETIDGIFCAPSLFDGSGPDVSSFAVVSRPPLTGADSAPARYELFNGQGYSDHLPLVLVLE